MKIPHLSPGIITKSFITIFVLFLIMVIPRFRHSIFFNLIPLCGVGLIIIIFYCSLIRLSVKMVVALITLAALLFHTYNCLRFGVNFAFDSPEYWHLAQGFATGHGLSGALAGIQAISLTHAYRLTLILKVTEREVVLLDIGSHDEVYR